MSERNHGTSWELRIVPVVGVPEIAEGMAIGELIAARAENILV